MPRSHAPRWAAAVLVVLLALPAGCARTGGEPFQPTLVRPVPVGQDEGTVGQRLRTASGTLAGLDVSLATYLTSADPNGELQAELTDPTTGEVLGSGVLDGEDIRDSRWATIPFDPPVQVSDPVDVTLTWTGITPVALWANIPDPSDPAEGIVNDPYRDGHLLRDGQPAQGDLAFRVRGGGIDRADDQVRAVVASAWGRLTMSPRFAVVLLLLLAGSVGLAMWGLRGSRGDGSVESDGAAVPSGDG